jgi:Leucine-rich repeat (LRR) protein
MYTGIEQLLESQDSHNETLALTLLSGLGWDSPPSPKLLNLLGASPQRVRYCLEQGWTEVIEQLNQFAWTIKEDIWDIVARLAEFKGLNKISWLYPWKGDASPISLHLAAEELREFFLYYAPLAHFPTFAASGVQLRRLGCSDCGLRELPASIYQFEQLTQLHLRGNQLRELPFQLCHLQKLELLDLTYNQLSRLPTDIGALKQLEFLYLSGNNFAPEERLRICRLLPNTLVYF